MGQARLDGLCQIYIHNDICKSISIMTFQLAQGAIIKIFAATSRKVKL